VEVSADCNVMGTQTVTNYDKFYADKLLTNSNKEHKSLQTQKGNK